MLENLLAQMKFILTYLPVNYINEQNLDELKQAAEDLAVQALSRDYPPDEFQEQNRVSSYLDLCNGIANSHKKSAELSRALKAANIQMENEIKPKVSFNAKVWIWKNSALVKSPHDYRNSTFSYNHFYLYTNKYKCVAVLQISVLDFASWLHVYP